MKEPKAKSSVLHKIKNVVFAVVFVLLGIVMVFIPSAMKMENLLLVVVVERWLTLQTGLLGLK